MATCTTTQRSSLYDDKTQFVVQIVDCAVVNGTPTESVVDISSATDMKIIFRKPDYTYLKVSASLYTAGTDGKIVYATIGDPENKTGDLDQLGDWEIQGRVTLPSGTWTSDTAAFEVIEILDS